MLKCEYYAKEIAESMRSGGCTFIKKHLYKGKGCTDDMRCEQCEKLLHKWLLEEYEPEIDWSKVPVDTPVMVREDDEEWRKRRFAFYLKDTQRNYWCFRVGCNSQDNDNCVYSWKYCKLAEGVDPTPYLKGV